MKYNIRGDNLEITEALKNHAEEKLSKLKKYFEEPENTNINVLMRLSGHQQVVEVTIPYKTIKIRAEERSDDLYNSINQVVDKIERQIKKNKGRMESKSGRESIRGFIKDFVHTEETSQTGQIVKRKSIEMKPMSEEEAILQMNLIDHDFFIFTHDQTNKAALVYKRKDENYGIIEAK